MANHNPVTFLDADGNEVSNDPIWQARRLLGVSEEEDMPEDQGPYDGLTGAQLKKLAKDRGVDISGLTKVGQVREALEAADEEEASDEETEEESGE